MTNNKKKKSVKSTTGDSGPVLDNLLSELNIDTPTPELSQFLSKTVPSTNDIKAEPLAELEFDTLPQVDEPVLDTQLTDLVPETEEPNNDEEIDQKPDPIVFEPVQLSHTIEEIACNADEPVQEEASIPAATVLICIPKLVFIVPYRNREHQMIFFKRHMKYVLEDMNKEDYKIYFVHQCDNREFNRGALKNIGFLVVRKQYPKHYQNITLVFNDVDTMPYIKNFLNYETVPGIVKHFYGFKFALGGIVSITAGDFEYIRGFPNFWAWGYEDNMLNNRVLKANMKIDRDQFFTIANEKILNLNNGMLRTVNRAEFERFAKNTQEGWMSITNLQYMIEEDVENEGTAMIQVTNFLTGTEIKKSASVVHDLRQGNKPFHSGRNGRVAAMDMTFVR